MMKIGIIATALACLWSACAQAYDDVPIVFPDQYIRGTNSLGVQNFRLECGGEWKPILVARACNSTECHVNVEGLPSEQWRWVVASHGAADGLPGWGVQIRGSSTPSKNNFKLTYVQHFPLDRFWSQPLANASRKVMSGTIETICRDEENP